MLFTFDLDGTLVDSLRDLTAAGNAMRARYGMPALGEDEVAAMVGEGAITLVKRLLGERNIPLQDALNAFLAEYDARLVNHTRPYEGIPEALDALAANASLAVLTNKPQAAALRILEELRLRRYFTWVLGGDGPHGRKPRAEGFHAVMSWAQQQPEHVVLVGDSVVDVLTARNAGTRVCVCRYGFGFRNCPPGTLQGDELVVDHPRELPVVLLAAGRPAHLPNGSS